MKNLSILFCITLSFVYFFSCNSKSAQNVNNFENFMEDNVAFAEEQYGLMTTMLGDSEKLLT